MLTQFRVGNYRSFKDVVTFSMVAADLPEKSQDLDENNLIPPPLLSPPMLGGSDYSLLKSCAKSLAAPKPESALARSKCESASARRECERAPARSECESVNAPTSA
jgi:AAA15 family ATPase/GTPase